MQQDLEHAPVRIPDAIRHAVYAHARLAFPEECCGYLLGDDEARRVVRCRNAQVDGRHPTHPERGADAGFVIADADLLAFARAFGAAEPPVVVYHSHPNGRAYFSDVDRQSALSEGRPTYPVQHLVVGVTAAGITEAALFAWRAGTATAGGDFVEVARWDGRC